MRKLFNNIVSLDLRSLAILRISLGLIVLADMWHRAKDLTAHYSDNGILPRSVLWEHFDPYLFFSVYSLSDNQTFSLSLFILTGVAATLFTFGFWTKIANVLLYLLLLSLHHRNPYILQGGDHLLRLLIFWSFFLPMANCWSLDAWRRKDENRLPVNSSWGVLLITQILIVYWCTAMLRTGPEWSFDRTALDSIFHYDQLLKPFGQWIFRFEKIFPYLTILVLYFERMIPFVFLMPLHTSFFRYLGIFSLWVFHAFILSTLEVGIFPYVSLAATLALIPSSFWEKKSGPEIQKSSHQYRFLALFFLGLLLLENQLIPFLKTPPIVHQAMQVVGLDQQWVMFSPRPPQLDGWYVFAVKDRSGKSSFRYLNGDPASSYPNKPAAVSQTYPNDRWRKYMMYYWIRNDDAHRNAVGSFLCREWNKGNEAVSEIQTLFFLETYEKGVGEKLSEPILLHQTVCPEI